MIKIANNRDGSWTVWNTITHECASIVTIVEHGFLARNIPKRYRVDKGRRTEASMLESFQEARGIANRLVK